MSSRFVLPIQTALDSNASPLAGAELYFYASGTSTLKNTYSDSALTTANTNPVVADSAGRFGDIFLSGSYKVVLKDSGGVEIWSKDPVTGSDGGVREDLASTTDAAKGATLVGYKHPGAGAVARNLYGKARESVTLEDFGAVGNGVTNDFTALKNAWVFARNNPGTEIKLLKTYLIEPSSNETTISAFFCDFSVSIVGNKLSKLLFKNVSAPYCIQLGAYSQNMWVQLKGFIVEDSGGCANGLLVTDIFQGRLTLKDLAVQNYTAGTGVVVANVQDVNFDSIRVKGNLLGFHSEDADSFSRADNQGGNWVTSTAAAKSTNNKYDLWAQSNTNGVKITKGDNFAISGLVQQAGTGNLLEFVDCSATYHLHDLYLETADASHKEIVTNDGCTGTFSLINVHGSSIGSNARFRNGTVAVINGPAWVGKFTLNNNAIVVYDAPPQSGVVKNDSSSTIELQTFRSISKTATSIRTELRHPISRRFLVKGSLEAAGSQDLFWVGNDSSFAKSKSCKIDIYFYDTQTSKTAQVQVYGDVEASYPSARKVETWMIGAATDVNFTIDLYQAGSSPFNQFRGRIIYNGTGTGHFEAWVTVFES